jgi:glycosyltransferase involved in cell wall biosynthesis
VIAIDLSPLLLDPRRGVARALHYLLEGLHRVRDASVRIEGFAPPERPGGEPTLAAGRGLDEVHRIGPSPVRPAAWRRALAEAIAARGAAVLLSPWARFPRTRVPVVAWIHEVPFARLGALEGRLRTFRHRRALARAAQEAAALVTPSQAVLADLLRLHPDVLPRAHVVPHGFDVDGWRCAAGLDTLMPSRVGLVPVPREVAARALGVDVTQEPDGGTALLLGTGRGAGGSRKKGVDVFLRAFAEGPIGEVEPTIVGAAPEAGEDVMTFPDADDYMVGLLIRSARVVVVPSRSEGFGFPVLEGFAAGVPVVASSAGALPEVSGGAARLVPPGDADALREAIARVATDEDLRARMIEDGRKRAQEFPVTAMARGWLRVLTKVGGIPWRG